MNRITAEQAYAQVGKRTRTAPLRNEILDLEPGEAIEVGFDEYKAGTVAQVANNLSRRSEARRYSVRKRRDGLGCFIICQPRND
jgi:hypothetical protein